MNDTRGSTEVVRIHLPEWRDSLAVNEEIRRGLRAGLSDFLLTGARGDRLLLNGINGPYTGRIRIDGDVGTELARDLDAEGILVVVNGSAGSGAGMRMKNGTLYLAGNCGALLGAGMMGGTILTIGEVGSRSGYRASGGIILCSSPPGPMVLDRSMGGKVETIRTDSAIAQEIQARVAAMSSFGAIE